LIESGVAGSEELELRIPNEIAERFFFQERGKAGVDVAVGLSTRVRRILVVHGGAPRYAFVGLAGWMVGRLSRGNKIPRQASKEVIIPRSLP
jgi:hypothetical protein